MKKKWSASQNNEFEILIITIVDSQEGLSQFWLETKYKACYLADHDNCRKSKTPNFLWPVDFIFIMVF